MHAIGVPDLHQHDEETHAVDRLSLRVKPGRVFALVDPDGAGKTAMMEILDVHHHVGISAFFPGPLGARRRSRSARRAR